MNNLVKYCKSPTIDIFSKLSEETQKELIKTSNDVLAQKTGNLNKALENT
jgi:hypothetical protein